MKNILEPSERENEWKKRSSQREIENILRYAKSSGAPRGGRQEGGWQRPFPPLHTHTYMPNGRMGNGEVCAKCKRKFMHM